MANNINYTLSNNLCTGCGICEDVCPQNSIVIKRINGEFRPVINNKTCLTPKCGKCLKVCPGKGIDLQQMAKTTFYEEDNKIDKYLGIYKSIYTGYSLDENIRYHSASGGLVSQFIIYLLENKIIDGAVVTSFSEDNITPITYIAKTKDDVLKAKSSKYCPVALNKIGNEIKNSKGKYVIVGLPCHIQGFRKRAKIDKVFQEKVIGFFSIYCSSNRTFNAQDFLFKKYRINKKNISYFAYRDNGCLGDMVVKNTDGTVISVPYIRYYGALRSFFKPRRCLTCIDHYGELADICFGDIHIKPYNNDKIGISSCIVRNSYWNNLMQQAEKEKYITLNIVDKHVLNESQKEMLYPKKRKAQALMNIDKYFFRRKVAIYDKILDKPRIKDYMSVIVANIQRFIGKHKVMWFIIELFNKNK